MSKLVIIPIICLINFYKYFVSPFLGSKCRYLPTCSEYFIESLNIHGFIIGLYLGIKRISKCHPIKYLGGGSGLDFVPRKNLTKEKLNG